MKLKLKNTPEQVELIRALGSKDHNTSAEAATAFAAFLGPVISKVLQVAATSTGIYTDSVYDEDDSPSYPLDLYYNESDTGYVTVWSQAMAGGLPTSQVEGVAEMKISTYRLDSAVSWMKKYARKSRLDIVSKALERMAQEILVKQERNAWAVIMKALGEARNVGATANNYNILVSGANRLRVEDMNKWMTMMRRINVAWTGEHSSSDVYGLTDMFVSPEVKEDIRSFAYNPMNTNSSPASDIPLPDSVRENVFRGGGTSELYGVRIIDLLELGKGDTRKYNKLAELFLPNDSNATNAFDATNDEVCVGLDASRSAFIRPVAQQHDSNGTFSVLPDDQWVARADKVGFYGFLEEGRICIDGRAVSGLIINR
jgi:hypothetical protein